MILKILEGEEIEVIIDETGISPVRLWESYSESSIILDSV
jgi:hypothetical protein